ncbi:MAG: DinB family protein [Planctomycetes bacterium]|nr:DinB family protein [Planctomycetota bacterium]
MANIPRVAKSEIPDFYHSDYEQLPESDGLTALMEQQRLWSELLAGIPDGRGSYRYAAEKWTLREVIGHVSDAERVFAYRLLRIARGDSTPLAPFDENAYVPQGRFERRAMGDLLEELALVRASTLALVKPLDAEQLGRFGTASGRPTSASGLAWLIAAHQRHHRVLVAERYL